MFLLWATVGAFVLRLNAGVSWSFIAVFLYGLFIARLLAEDAVQKWYEQYISPGMSGGLSIANPRVRTFELHLATIFLEEVSAQMSHRLSAHKEVTDHLGPSLLKAFNATSELLQKLVVEEYPSKVRVYLWLVSDSRPTHHVTIGSTSTVRQDPGNLTMVEGDTCGPMQRMPRSVALYVCRDPGSGTRARNGSFPTHTVG